MPHALEHRLVGSVSSVLPTMGRTAALLLALPSAAQSQDLLAITSPPDGAIVSPGQTIQVTVTSPAGAAFAAVGLVGESPIGLPPLATSVPAQFSIRIPTN